MGCFNDYWLFQPKVGQINDIHDALLVLTLQSGGYTYQDGVILVVISTIAFKAMVETHVKNADANLATDAIKVMKFKLRLK